MEEIMTPSEVAALLKIHLKTVYKLAEKGVIPGNRIGRSWRFSRSDVLELVSTKSMGLAEADDGLHSAVGAAKELERTDTRSLSGRPGSDQTSVPTAR